MTGDPLLLRALTPEDVERVRVWREATPSLFRTRAPLTPEMQQAFYRETVSARAARDRYWAVTRGIVPGELVGQVGLCGIEWENGLAEISLIVAPAERQQGAGAQIVRLILREAFDRMRLKTVWGECYGNNETGLAFWENQLTLYRGWSVGWPRRHWWDGQLFDSLLFQFDAQSWAKVTRPSRIGGGYDPNAPGF